MAIMDTKKIRNIVLLGHGGCGKTSLAEAMLYIKKETDRLGKPSEGNTVCDYDAEEIKRGFTLSASIAPVFHNGVKINIIDTPGYLDFQSEALQALRVAGSALIVVDGKAGVEVGTEIAWDLVCKDKMPRAFFINKCDDPETRFRKVFLEMHEKFGNSICPVVIPLLEGDDIVGLLDLIDMRAVAFAHGRDGQPIEIPAGNEERIERCLSMLHEAVAGISLYLLPWYQRRNNGLFIFRKALFAQLFQRGICSCLFPTQFLRAQLHKMSRRQGFIFPDYGHKSVIAVA